jgi:hypothetical protein
MVLLSIDATERHWPQLAEMYHASAIRLCDEASSLSERLANIHRQAAEEFARRLRGER